MCINIQYHSMCINIQYHSMCINIQTITILTFLSIMELRTTAITELHDTATVELHNRILGQTCLASACRGPLVDYAKQGKQRSVALFRQSLPLGLTFLLYFMFYGPANFDFQEIE